MRKVILAVVILATILGFIFWQSTGDIFNKKKEEGPITLTYWSVQEDEIVLKIAAENYQKFHPNVKINIVKQSLLNYRTRLQTQLRAGQGPDIFRIHSSWLPMLQSDLASLPVEILSIDEYQRGFYPIIKDTLVSQGKVYAIPTEIDGLVLFYNEEILQGAGVNPPKTWQEFVDTARRVTVRSQSGQIQTAGAALGTTTNINFWPEIINLLFLQQPDTNLMTPSTKGGAEVIQFYTSFVTDPRNKTWDVNLASSGQMFTAGKLAFYFAPARQAQVIWATNPNLPFKVISVPQLPGKTIGVGTFWAEAVSVRSIHSDEAWQFLKYLASPQVLQTSNQIRVDEKIQPKVYPRIDMGQLQSADSLLGAVVLQAPYFKGWYLNSDTQDVGLNQEMIAVFGSAINSVMQGSSAQSALKETNQQIQQVVDKYTKAAQPASK